jgi:hypothetical protein
VRRRDKVRGVQVKVGVGQVGEMRFKGNRLLTIPPIPPIIIGFIIPIPPIPIPPIPIPPIPMPPIP